VTDVEAGDRHAHAIQTEGAEIGIVWSWGDNTNGALGDGTVTNRDVPIRVLEDAIAVSAADTNTLFVTQTWGGHQVLWGTGNHNGGPSSVNADSVTQVPVWLLLGDLVDVSAGVSLRAALKADTSIVAWGSVSGSYQGDGFVLGTASPTDDPDGDGLTTTEEWALGTDPYVADTNGDGILDGAAVASGLSATNHDMDADGLVNSVEIELGTDPFNPDTDGDTVDDGEDDFPLDPTRSQAPSPDPEDETPPTITLDEPTNADLISSVP
jgi:alpha-tubulin suppressor-like RCC1 family protein